MKKIIVLLMALMATMSINAQLVKVYKNGELVKTYTNTASNKVRVEFKEKTTGTTNGHDWVKIGGVRWATMNLGATTAAGSPATCYGDYYAWGETNPRYTSITIIDASNVSFGGWSGSHTGGYSTSDYPSYTGETLDADHDAATKNWGADWRTPTDDDFSALAEACSGYNYSQDLSTISNSTPTGGIYWLPSDQEYLPEYQGAPGILFVDKTDTSNRVFFPATGYCYDTDFGGGGLYGDYWTSVLHWDMEETKISAMTIDFSSKVFNMHNDTKRCFGFTVRPVSE